MVLESRCTGGYIGAILHNNSLFCAAKWNKKIIKPKTVGTEKQFFFLNKEIKFWVVERKYQLRNCWNEKGIDCKKKTLQPLLQFDGAISATSVAWKTIYINFSTQTTKFNIYKDESFKQFSLTNLFLRYWKQSLLYMGWIK